MRDPRLHRVPAEAPSPDVRASLLGRPAVRPAVIAALLGTAFAIRVWGLRAGIPYALGVDEPVILERSLRILRTGDWNPHFFDYPSFLIYLHALVAGVRFLWGAAHLEWASLASADIAAFYTWGRFVVALIGTATVWLTYRIGKDLDSPWLGVLAAAELAVLPFHVRESHYMLADVPVTCLMMLALWLGLRATTGPTAGAYALAGAAVGLAAATKYNGAVALVPLLVIWFAHERSSADGIRKLSALVTTMLVVFVVAAPYTVLDLPAFLDAFGAELARLSPRARALAEPAWKLYLKHLAHAGAWWIPAAAIGAGLILVDRAARRPWLPLLAFVLAYYYVLATHSMVFARYALPLMPALCLLAAVPVVWVARFVERRQRPRWRSIKMLILTAGVFVLTAGFSAQSVQWLHQLRRPDTRSLAAAWMIANMPSHARLAVEADGPTNLPHAGFAVVKVQRLIDWPFDWYVSEKIEYLIDSSPDVRAYQRLFQSAPIVFQVAPASDRWGPMIHILRMPGPDKVRDDPPAASSKGGLAMTLQLSTAAFQPGGTIPKKFTCDGPDLSPALTWSEPPAGTGSLALIMDDPDAPVGTWVHWVLYDVPSTVRELSEDVPKQETLVSGARQGRNDFRKIGYGGPCPPPGPAHRYFFKLYALDSKTNLKPGASKADVEKAMKGHILAQAELMGRYQR